MKEAFVRRLQLSALKVLEDFASPPKKSPSGRALTVLKNPLTRSSDCREILWGLLEWVTHSRRIPGPLEPGSCSKAARWGRAGASGFAWDDRRRVDQRHPGDTVHAICGMGRAGKQRLGVVSPISSCLSCFYSLYGSYLGFKPGPLFMFSLFLLRRASDVGSGKESVTSPRISIIQLRKWTLGCPGFI